MHSISLKNAFVCLKKGWLQGYLSQFFSTKTNTCYYLVFATMQQIKLEHSPLSTFTSLEFDGCISDKQRWCHPFIVLLFSLFQELKLRTQLVSILMIYFFFGDETYLSQYSLALENHYVVLHICEGRLIHTLTNFAIH